MRIVSLLPSTTEILFAVGAGPDVVAVTFECDFPIEARERRIVSTSALPDGLDPRSIDAWVAAAMERGEDLYHLDAGALSDLDADLVVTQDLCAVCAVDVSVVDDALAHLGCTAEVLTVDPHTLEEVLESVVTLGRRTDNESAATSIVEGLRDRLRRVAEAVADQPHPRVMLLEWTDPPYSPGHWIPEMVTRAGGVPVLGEAGARSVRVTWDDVRDGAPDVIVAAPCGYHVDDAARMVEQVLPHLPPDVPVWAVDANASWARPGPRLVDGVEALSGILHGESGAVPVPPPGSACRVR